MRTLISVLLFLLSSGSVLSQTISVRQKEFNLEKGMAIQGYDPVSYFKGVPQHGSTAFSTQYNGVTYRFSSAENLATFNKNPAGYEPQYGGWCAYAMGAKGEKVEIDPETFKIIGGRLYLFYNKYFNNTLKSWNKAEVTLKANADANWKRIAHL
jgi:YHS domain-containing protein